MTFDPRFPILALVTGFGAMLVWGIVMVRAVWAWRVGIEHRGMAWLIMPLGAFLAALGTVASAIGFAAQRGLVIINIDPDALSLVSSMGRGALLMSGLIVLAHYRPRR